MDDLTAKGFWAAVGGVIGTPIGVIGTAFFRWLIDSGRQKSEDKRWEQVHERIAKLEDGYWKTLQENFALRYQVTELRKENAQQAEQIKELQAQVATMSRKIDGPT